MKPITFGIFLLLFLLSGVSVFGQSIFVGPDGKFEGKMLSGPYAFYSEAFGTAAAYAYGVTGYPQK